MNFLIKIGTLPQCNNACINEEADIDPASNAKPARVQTISTTSNLILPQNNVDNRESLVLLFIHSPTVTIRANNAVISGTQSNAGGAFRRQTRFRIFRGIIGVASLCTCALCGIEITVNSTLQAGRE